ncbi:HNH endonuclease [Staphylococcus epidermidis]|uniref:HNH endonuclease n=1 Tax=Staphylococcus epidermidis TaxID=1282 RepID=UPI001D1626A0|nr:HNH endonuclease [Staphylococcus epidermidis]
MTNTQWVIPCNVKFYNVVVAFDKLDVIDWKQNPNLKKAKKGDVLYIYISAPIKSIKYQCLIKEVNKPKSTIDDSQFVIKGDNYINYGNYMELKLLNKLDDDQLDLEFLQDNGLKGNVQGPMTLKEPLKSYIQKVLKTNILNLDNELENTEYVEGKPYVQYGIKYERNQALRNEAIKFHGTTCKVCGFDFKAKYGDLGEGFIEIHHLKPMFLIKREIKVNPQKDLVPLCSNCHKMIHRNTKQPLTIKELTKIVNYNSK